MNALLEYAAAQPAIPSVFPELAATGGEITATDLFCGGGGSSLGMHHVPGVRVRYAINHWDLAIQAHQHNFPDTDHEVSEIETVHPRRFERTDIAWFSPSCTARAYCGPRGLDEDSVRSRATMWDTVRWTAYHRYDAVVVENVIETKLWCDGKAHEAVDPKTGKLRGCSCGDTYDDWLRQMLELGYEHREVYFNSQHALVPQSRDRMYIVFWRTGISAPDLDFKPPSFCSTCDGVTAGVQTWKPAAKGSTRSRARTFEWGKFGVNYLYACPECAEFAAPGVLGSHSIINHDLPIATIGSRKKPFAPNTRRRIKVGVPKVLSHRGVQLQVGGNLFERPGYARLWSLDDPLRTVTTSPYLAVILRYGGQSPAPRSTEEPTMGITAHDRQIGVVVPNMTNNQATSTDQPLGAVTTGNRHMLVSMRQHSDAFSVAQPAPTVAAGGQHHAMVVYNGMPGHVRDLDQPAGTVKTRDSQAVIYPFRKGGVPARLEVPTHTVDTRNKSALLELTDEDIDAMLFRMLHPEELQRAQAMHVHPDGTPYTLTARVKRRNGRFADLTNEQRVKMIGNAVSSPVATLLVAAIANSLAGGAA